jgi:RecA/RadA recombinase
MEKEIKAMSTIATTTGNKSKFKAAKGDNVKKVNEIMQTAEKNKAIEVQNEEMETTLKNKLKISTKLLQRATILEWICNELCQ